MSDSHVGSDLPLHNAAVYMPPALAHSGVVTCNRPATTLHGGRFQSHSVMSSSHSLHAGSCERARPPSVPVSAMRDVVASKIAAQLLMHAGHPAFASYMNVKDQLSTEYYQSETYTQLPRPTSVHASVHAPGPPNRPATAGSIINRNRQLQSSPKGLRPSRVALYPSNTNRGWMNSLGDYYDTTIGEWVKLPANEPPDHLLPSYRRAALFHSRKLMRKVLLSWGRDYMTACRHRRRQIARAKAHATTQLLATSLQGFLFAVDCASTRRTADQKAAFHHSRMLQQKTLAGLKASVQSTEALQLKQLVASNRICRVRQRHILRAWQDCAQKKADVKVITMWALQRMRSWRLRETYQAWHALLLGRIQKSRCNDAQLKHQRRMLAQAMSSWQWVIVRNRNRRKVICRHLGIAARRMQKSVFHVWKMELLLSCREQLTEQVYDLKRELAYAVAWSD